MFTRLDVGIRGGRIAALSAALSKCLFVMNGETTGGFWLAMKILFASSVFAAAMLGAELFFSGRQIRKKQKDPS